MIGAKLMLKQLQQAQSVKRCSMVYRGMATTKMEKPVFAKAKKEEFVLTEGEKASFETQVKFLDSHQDLMPFIDRSWIHKIHPLITKPEKLGLKLNASLETKDPKNIRVSGAFQMSTKPRDKKAKITLPMDALSLSAEQEHVFSALAGPRLKNKKLTVTSNRYETRVLNHKDCCNMIQALLETTVTEAAAGTTASTPYNTE